MEQHFVSIKKNFMKERSLLLNGKMHTKKEIYIC